MSSLSSPSDAVEPAPSRPNAPFRVFDYESVSALLEAYILRRKGEKSDFSISRWARELGLPTSGIIVNYVKKRRLPSEALAIKIAASMGLEPADAEYFTTLVASERAQHEESHLQLFLKQRLESLRLKASALNVADSEATALSHLQLVAVKEALGLRGATSDPSWIRDQLDLSLTEAEIRAALQTLIRCGVIRIEEGGRLTLFQAHIGSPQEQPFEAIRDFHRQSLIHASSTLARVPNSLRHFESYVMPVETSQIAEAKQTLVTFLHDFAARYEAKAGQGDAVYQLCLQYVPLTKGHA